MALACLFLLEGVFDIAVFFKVRATKAAGWFLFDGIVTLLLGLMIYMQWPSSSAWAIGTLVGASLIVSGVRTIMVALAVREADTAISSLAA